PLNEKRAAYRQLSPPSTRSRPLRNRDRAERYLFGPLPLPSLPVPLPPPLPLPLPQLPPQWLPWSSSPPGGGGGGLFGGLMGSNAMPAITSTVGLTTSGCRMMSARSKPQLVVSRRNGASSDTCEAT